MRTFLLVLFVSIGLTASSQTYYIVRHAEKAVPSAGSIMSTPDDPPLSEAGQLRALALVEELKGKEIKKKIRQYFRSYRKLERETKTIS